MEKLEWSLFALLAIFGFGGWVGVDAQDRLVPHNGAAVTGTVQSMAGDGQVMVEGKKEPIPLASLRSIVRPTRPEPLKGPRLELHLLDRSRILTPRLLFQDGRYRAGIGGGSPIEIPAALVRGFWLAPPKANGGPAEGWASFAKALPERQTGKDILMVLTSEKAERIEGFIQELTEEKAVFSWNDAPRRIARAKVLGGLLAQTKDPVSATGRVLLFLKDGSSLGGRLRELRDGKLRLVLGEEAESLIPWASVLKMEVQSDRILFLSDTEPEEVQEEAWVSFPGRWRKDLSVLGRPLTAGGQVFEKGLGVKARSLLTFRPPEGFALFSTLLTLDDETEGRGDCLCRVLGDGRVLYEGRIKGKDKPVAIELPVQGLRKLTLAVEPGEGYDLSDHIDWCDARWIKP